jgi:hypothetical protein
VYKLQLLFKVHWYELMILLGEIERIGEEAMVAYFKALSQK